MNDSVFGDDGLQSMSGQTQFQILVLTKHNGPLTKEIELDDDGKICSDGSACKMSVGRGVVEFGIRLEALVPASPCWSQPRPSPWGRYGTGTTSGARSYKGR